MFERIYVEITDVCNLNCCFCPKTERQKTFMTDTDFAFVLDKIRAYTNYIFLHVLGEPLLHPDLKNILEIARDKGFNVNITTNGTLLKEKGDILLPFKNIKKVFISLHSFEGNDGKDLKGYLEDVFNFSLKTDSIVSFRLWNEGSSGKNSLNGEIIKFFEDKTKLDIKKLFLAKNSITIGEKRYLEKAERFSWPNISGDIKKVSFCHGLSSQLAILCDGTVIPCCLDCEGKINLGNIFKEDIKDILNGERAKNFLAGVKNRKMAEELCKRCGYAERF